MKRIVYCFLTIVLLAGLSLSCTSTPAPAPATPRAPTPAAAPPKPEAIKIDMLGFLPKSSLVRSGANVFPDYVNARAPGELFINYRGGPEVIPGPEQSEAVIKGVIGLSIVPGAYYESLVPQVVLLSGSELNDLGIHRTTEERMPGGVYDYLRQAHEKKGLYFLGRGEAYSPFYLFTNRGDVKRVADMKKMSVGASGILHHRFVQALGASVINVETGDTYSALERKLVDSITKTIGDAVRYKWYEVLKYIFQPPYKTNSNAVYIVNPDVWKKLPKKLQDLMTEAMIYTENYMSVYAPGEYALAEKEVILRGMKVIELPQEDIKNFQSLYVEDGWKRAQDKVSPEEYQKMRELAKRKR